MATNGCAGDSPCHGWIRPGNRSWPSGSGAVVLGEMRGKDEEYDYLFKGGSPALPALLCLQRAVRGLSLLWAVLSPCSTLGMELEAGALACTGI